MKTKVEFSMAWFKSHAFLLGALAFIEVFSIGFFFVFNWLNSEVGYYLFLLAFQKRPKNHFIKAVKFCMQKLAAKSFEQI